MHLTWQSGPSSHTIKFLKSDSSLLFFVQPLGNLIYAFHIEPRMSVQSSLAEIERCLAIAKQHDEKLAKGVKSAAPKLRAALLDIGKLVGESRRVALASGKAIAVKKRVPKAVVAPEAASSSPEEPPKA